MNLKDYIDQIRFEVGDNELPWEYLKRKINNARRMIAKRTRCLQNWYECESIAHQGKYRIPHSSVDNRLVECIEIFDVYYDNVLLTEKIPREMRRLLQITSEGIPSYWTYFGGDAQPTGYIQLYPIPNCSEKIIKIHAITYPEPLTETTRSCELNDTIQDLVIKQVCAEIFLNKWHPQATTLLNLVERGIRDNTTLKDW